MEMVVGNFLNIFAVSAIILLLTILLLGLSYHFRFLIDCVVFPGLLIAEIGNRRFIQNFRTIDINTGLPYEDGLVNAIKSLMFQAFLETILQLYGFMANPALRFIVKQKIQTQLF